MITDKKTSVKNNRIDKTSSVSFMYIFLRLDIFYEANVGHVENYETSDKNKVEDSCQYPAYSYGIIGENLVRDDDVEIQAEQDKILSRPDDTDNV